MTDAPSPDPRPLELPGLDSWWDGTQWRRTGEPASRPTYGRDVEDPGHGRRVASPWDSAPVQSPRMAAR